MQIEQIWYTNPWLQHPDVGLNVSTKVAVGRTFKATGADTVIIMVYVNCCAFT